MFKMITMHLKTLTMPIKTITKHEHTTKAKNDNNGT